MEHTDTLNENELTHNNSYIPVCNLLHFDFQLVVTKTSAGCHYLTFFLTYTMTCQVGLFEYLMGLRYILFIY